jgi:hypothetical protein
MVMMRESGEIGAGLPPQLRSVVAARYAGACAVVTYGVGADWRPRRVTSVTVARKGRASGVIGCRGWGSRVAISAPPPAHIVNRTQV